MSDRELLELAAKAAGIQVNIGRTAERDACGYGHLGLWTMTATNWNPLTDDGDRYRLAQTLRISIDYQDCCAWKRLPGGDLIQEFWGGDCGDEAHAIVRAAAEIAARRI